MNYQTFLSPLIFFAFVSVDAPTSVLFCFCGRSVYLSDPGDSARLKQRGSSPAGSSRQGRSLQRVGDLALSLQSASPLVYISLVHLKSRSSAEHLAADFNPCTNGNLPFTEKPVRSELSCRQWSDGRRQRNSKIRTLVRKFLILICPHKNNVL